MPIQVNEMIIRANIVENADRKTAAPPNAPAAGGGDNKDEIVKECVAMVLEIINSKTQR